MGIVYDTSHCPAIVGADCGISLGPQDTAVQPHQGTIEVPVGAIATHGPALRHFQLTALSLAELAGQMRHAAAMGQDSLTLVSHSFEMLSRDRQRINPILVRRFEGLCAAIPRIPGLQTATYAESPPPVSSQPQSILLHAWRRTLGRQAEQTLGNMLYGSR